MRTERDIRIVILLVDAFMFWRIPYRILNVLVLVSRHNAARHARSR
ncbi:hypothetical protein BCEP27_170039 [Burkholderia cepacia]